MNINRVLKRLTISAVLLLALAVTASAQTLTGTIAGRVLDAQGGALPGVTVTLASRTGETVQITNEQGDFRFLGLSTGIYEVRTSLQGFKPSVQSGLDITIGRSIDLKLTLEVGGLTESITVEGSSAKVDARTTATDTRSSDLHGEARGEWPAAPVLPGDRVPRRTDRPAPSRRGSPPRPPG